MPELYMFLNFILIIIGMMFVVTVLVKLIEAVADAKKDRRRIDEKIAELDIRDRDGQIIDTMREARNGNEEL